MSCFFIALFYFSCSLLLLLQMDDGIPLIFLVNFKAKKFTREISEKHFQTHKLVFFWLDTAPASSLGNALSFLGCNKIAIKTFPWLCIFFSNPGKKKHQRGEYLFLTDIFTFNRIDGFLLNVTANASAIEINNGTVLLDVQVRFSSEVQETSVLLMSLQYKSGI